MRTRNSGDLQEVIKTRREQEEMVIVRERDEEVMWHRMVGQWPAMCPHEWSKYYFGSQNSALIVFLDWEEQ